MTINATTTQPVTPDEPVTRAQMLRHITEAVEGGLPAPMSIDLSLYDTGNRRLQLRMDDNRADEVDAWAQAVPQGGDGSAVLGDKVYHSGDGKWRVYSYDPGRGVLWHGWKFEVWSSIDEPQDGDR